MKLEIGTKVTVKTSQRPYYWNYGMDKDKTTIEPFMIGTIKSVNVPSVNRKNVKFHVADFEVNGNVYRTGLQSKEYKIIGKRHPLKNLS
jgi:hypothetical protein